MALALSHQVSYLKKVPPTFEEIHRTHGAAIWRWAQRLVGPSAQEELEDVLQDVLLAVYRQLPSLRAEAALSTWLYRITSNVVTDRRRRRRVRNWVARENPPPPPVESPHDALVRSRAEAAVYRVLETLDAEARELLIWFEIEGLSGAEIAQLLDVKMSTLWVRLHRARAAFRKQYVLMKASEQ